MLNFAEILFRFLADSRKSPFHHKIIHSHSLSYSTRKTFFMKEKTSPYLKVLMLFKKERNEVRSQMNKEI